MEGLFQRVTSPVQLKKVHKIAFLGSDGAGKSATIRQLCGAGGPPPPYRPTVGVAAHHIDRQHGSHTVRLSIWECGAQALRTFRYSEQALLEGCHALVYVLSACDRMSMAYVRKRLTEPSELEEGVAVKIIAVTQCVMPSVCQAHACACVCAA
eukprot:PLAT12321.2.p2 GENE.PLAT12321.2~~PLAT12321.2.p2  ORF type:complete len:169 (+),score=41.89 PLAT12321.2:49-507(+)